MNSTAEFPYELHTHGFGAFVIFNVAEQIALPLIALIRATLRTVSERDELVLEFPNMDVVIEGRALGLLMEHLLAGNVKRISCAHDGTCEVTAIRMRESDSNSR